MMYIYIWIRDIIYAVIGLKGFYRAERHFAIIGVDIEKG